ncbi:MAG: glycoside hydrolase family 99-like domain-containing protein [Janthinobacterium lividum]
MLPPPPAAALPPPGSDAHRTLLHDSGLFMAGHYLHAYPALAAAHTDPLRHYCDTGWREHRQPNPYFDPAFYRARAMASAGTPDTDPLLHYALLGSPDGAWPNPCLDPAWYRATHGAHPLDPLVRFAARDEALDLRPCAHFDTAWYRARHALPATASPLLHYLARRHTARVSPLPEFDVAHYCRQRRDVAAHGCDPFEHYLEHGWREGENPSPGFETAFYARRHLAHAPDANPLLHFLARRAEGTAPAPTLRLALRDELTRARAAGLRRVGFPLHWIDGIAAHIEPLRVFLSEPDLRLGFRLVWGNEHLAARPGLAAPAREQLQDYHRDDSDDADICALLAACFADPRHLRHDGRPVLAIHSPAPALDPALAQVCERWRRHLPDAVIHLTRRWLPQ